MMELLKLDHISHSAGNEKLHTINLSIESGENTVVFGPEHSGINLLVMIILGFEKPQEGDVIFMGKSIRGFSYVENNDYKRKIGYIHGDYGLISNMTVEDNISLPLEYHSNLTVDEIDDVVDTMLKEFNLDKCRDLRPIRLSRSEILRTAYARSIINNPQLLIVDKALEGHSMINIRTFLGHLMKRCQHPEFAHLFLTYHPQNFLDFAVRYIMIYNGRIVFEGNKHDFVHSNDPYLIQYRTASTEGPMEIQ